MANQPGYMLYGWQRYDWARLSGAHDSITMWSPSSGSVTRSTAVITVNRPDAPAQHRVLFGPRLGAYTGRSEVFADPTPASSVTVRLSDLKPNTQYHFIDIAVATTGPLTGVPLVTNSDYFSTSP